MRRIKLLTCCLLALMLVLCLSCCGEEAVQENSSAGEQSVFGTEPSMAVSADPAEAEPSAAAETAIDEAAAAEPVQGIGFPYELDGGKLLVTSLFQSSMMNPDCDLEEGEDIATLEIVNQSDECLTLGSFEATMPDGRALHFTATDIPPGAKVWAFETSNQSMETAEPCISLTVEPQYEAEGQRMPDAISVTVDGITVTLTNLTEEPVRNLTVCCHGVFDDAYFGGLVYTYTVDEIPAGGTETIEANDCFLGDAEVVRVTLEGDS